eukprot:gene31383-40771_t
MEFTSSVPKLRLYYFNIPGKGESIRLACAYAKLPLEDVRITNEEFSQLKANGKLAFGQVPALEVDDKQVIIQSASIMRYIGKLCDLYPTSDHLKAAYIDSIVDEEIDLFMGLSVSRYRARFGFGCLDDATVSTVRESLNSEVLPRHLSFLESMLSQSPSGWIASTAGPRANDGISRDILQPYPLLLRMIEMFLSLPAVAEYYQTHTPLR